MCNLKTEGRKYGCGHYKITKKLEKVDCNSKRCSLSASHSRPCHDCSCEKFLGPDLEERVIEVTSDYCDHCFKWYQSNGHRR